MSEVIPAPPAVVGRFDLIFAVGADDVMLLDQARTLAAGVVRRLGTARVLVEKPAFVF
ncbi:MAG: hypothetical protein ACLP8S_26260 [Solirubrobacteraceae bacterium]